MSSPTETSSGRTARAARRASLRAAIAPWLSWIAAAVGLAFLAAFVLQAGLFALLVPQEKITPPTVENPYQITSYRSTVVGRDKNGQPYEIKTKRGWQDKDNSKLMYLEEVAATFRRSTGEPVTLTGRSGRYDTEAKGLDIEGDVVLSQEGRFTARMARVHIAVPEKSLTSDVAVAVTFNGGTVDANGMKITNDGNDILFLNGVRSHFESAPAKGDKSP
ncbi:MAG: LPS export ABC transporter periplasmic protein LptC [Rhizobiales bacterium]|nr:LPS export ABC transporter periplasmic protein LptC [Hyphomicrobiales bacterium]